MGGWRARPGVRHGAQPAEREDANRERDASAGSRKADWRFADEGGRGGRAVMDADGQAETALRSAAVPARIGNRAVCIGGGSVTG